MSVIKWGIGYPQLAFSNSLLQSFPDLQNVNQVLMSIVHGAVEIPDPQSQKSCFGTLKKLVEIWGKSKPIYLVWSIYFLSYKKNKKQKLLNTEQTKFFKKKHLQQNIKQLLLDI